MLVEGRNMIGLRGRFLGALALVALLALVGGEAAAQKAAKTNNAANNKAGKTAVQVDATKKEIAPLPAASKLTAGQLAQLIDTAIDKKLTAEKVDPSTRSADEEFLRRAYLDITGKIPTADKA